ncbi:hypothetical protein ACTA71_007621 [Dictyostelium dimigraforme]
MNKLCFLFIFLIFLENGFSQGLVPIQYLNIIVSKYESLEFSTFINDSYCHYYTRDIKNQVFAGLIYTNYEKGIKNKVNSTCLTKQIKEPLLNYENVIGILGFKDSILICGNHQSNNSLVVYSYNFKSEEQSFVFTDRISITHVIQPQFSSTRYCVFFSDKTNSTILYDIYENEVIVNHYHLNLNISRDLFENSTRTISYFIHPKEFKNKIPDYSEPTNEPIKNYTQVNNNQNNSSTGSILSNTFFMILISVLLSFSTIFRK